MVNNRHKNRFFAVKVIAEKNFPAIYPCFGCVTANPNHFEKPCFVASDDIVYSRCVRLGRKCDLFFSESVCEWTLCSFFPFLTVLIKRIEKAKNLVKSNLEAAIKTIDSKHVEILFAIESADSKRKKMESVAQNIGLKHQKLRQAFAKQKRLRNIWAFFDRRENDLLNQKHRIIRALDEINPFSINDDGAKLLENSAELSFNQNPELSDFGYSQIFDGFDFSSTPIFPFTTFQK